MIRLVAGGSIYSAFPPIELCHYDHGGQNDHDKKGSVLRIETAITQARDFKVFRGTAAKPEDKRWRQLRKGAADLRRRAEVSQAANERYAEALASVPASGPIEFPHAYSCNIT
ncbi:MAG: hypothetical protein ACP5I8_03500 [Phycisphaerae bacterium]